MKTWNCYAHDIYHARVKKYRAHFKASGHSPWSWRSRVALIAEIADYLNQDAYTILDVGCGNGRMGSELQAILSRRGIRTAIDGVDFLRDATELAKSVYNYRNTFWADVTDTNSFTHLLRGERYELVFCCELFLYIRPQDYRRFLQDLRTCMTRDGCFLLVIPNLRSLYHRAIRQLRPESFHSNFKYSYTLETVACLLAECGFEIKAHFGVDYLFWVTLDLLQRSQTKQFLSFEAAILASPRVP